MFSEVNIMHKRPDYLVTKFALYYRKYRAQKKAGIFEVDSRYTPECTKEYLDTFEIDVKPANNEFGWEVYQRGKLKPLFINKSGYVIAPLYDKVKYQQTKKRAGVSKMFLLHRLLYVLYKGCIPYGMTVDHIDGNKLNNSINNLQLLTRSENNKKRFENIR